MFVGTKRQCREIIKDEATKCASPLVDHRWLGGMLTNFNTVVKSIKKLKDMDADIESGLVDKMIKKSILDLRESIKKLNLSFGGIKELDTIPDCLFIVDIGFHKIAVKEAVKLGIPIVALVDTNHDPSDIDYIIPANDDSSSSVKFFTEIISAKISESKKIEIESIVEDSNKLNNDTEVNETRLGDKYMSNISVSSVKELRQRTGLGMMDCKKALDETHGILIKQKIYYV